MKPDSPLRLFIGSSICEPLQIALQPFYLKYPPKDDSDTIRWVPPESWHLTWLFLGNVKPDILPDIQMRLTRILSGHDAPIAQPTNLGIWPSLARPQVVVCQLEKTAEILKTADIIRQEFKEYADAKAFHPHITLGRCKKRVRFRHVPDFIQWKPSPVACPLNQIHLYQSILMPEGAVYKALLTCSCN